MGKKKEIINKINGENIDKVDKIGLVMKYNIYNWYSEGEFCCSFMVSCELHIAGNWCESFRFQPLLGRLLCKSGNNHKKFNTTREYYLDCAQRAQSYMDELKLFYGIYHFY